MAFDADRYEREIIHPLRGHTKLPDGDLAARYAVTPGMDAAQLAEQLRTIRRYWNQNSGGHTQKARVCKLLIAADEELKTRFGKSLEDPKWWAEEAARNAQQSRAQVAQLAAELKSSFSQVVTRDQLNAVLKAYPGLGQAQVEEAARLAGLTVVDAVQLPETSGLDPTAFRKLAERLGQLNVHTIVHLLHPNLTQPFRLLRRFEVVGGLPVPLDQATVEARIRAAEALADSGEVRARKEALGILLTGLRAGADLRTIVLFQIIDIVRRAGELPTAMLVSRVAALGLDKAEAQVLVQSLPRGGPARSPADEVRELLAEGRLRAAQAALSALGDTDTDAAAVRAMVEASRIKVETLVRDATAAAASGREDEAHRLLLEAVTIAQDDEDIAGRLRRLPLAAPRGLTCVPAGIAVRLGWQAPPSAPESVRYRVVRTEGRPSASAEDGTRVAETTSTSCEDPRPPVARDLHYAVYASADATVWSRPAAARPVTVLPPITDVQVRADPDRVTVSWRIHTDLVAVRVRRGTSPPTSGHGSSIAASTTSFADTNVVEGVTYYYAIVPVYRDEQGREVEGERVLIDVTPRTPAVAVTDLRAEIVSTSDNGARIRLRWPRPANGTPVRIRYSPQQPPWSVGSTQPVDAIEHYGTEVTGSSGRQGDDDVMEADVPTGFHIYVPFAIGGTGAVVGRAVGLGVADPVRSLELLRLGNKARLSWVWPREVTQAEVQWSQPDLPVQVTRVTRGASTPGGSFEVEVGTTGGTAAVRSVVAGPTGDSFSEAVVVEAPPLGLKLRYRILRNRFKPWQIEITADNDCVDVDLTLVVSKGEIMPLRPEQGTVTQRFTGLTLYAGVPATFEFPAIKGARWVKAFCTRPPDALVVDPPINDLKI